MSKGTPYFFLLPAFLIVTIALIVPVLTQSVWVSLICNLIKPWKRLAL